METNYIEKSQNIYKKVKTYDYNPTYQLKVNKNLCTYEVYINEGWSKGTDLSKEAPTKLEAEVAERMKQLVAMYNSKDVEGLAKEQYLRTKEIDQSMS